MKRSLALIVATLALFGSKSVERSYSDLGASALRASAAQSHYLLSPHMAALIGDAPFAGTFELAYGPVSRLRGGIAGRDGKLMFIPEASGAKDDGSTAIWMVWNNGGFVMSDALQGFAPATPATNAVHIGAVITWDPRQAVSRVPSKITITNQASLVTLSINRVSSKAPPAEAFALPEGFRKYANPEEMAAELLRRRTDAISGTTKARYQRYGDSPGYDVEDLPSPRRP